MEWFPYGATGKMLEFEKIHRFNGTHKDLDQTKFDNISYQVDREDIYVSFTVHISNRLLKGGSFSIPRNNTDEMGMTVNPCLCFVGLSFVDLC